MSTAWMVPLALCAMGRAAAIAARSFAQLTSTRALGNLYRIPAVLAPRCLTSRGRVSDRGVTRTPLEALRRAWEGRVTARLGP
jgi:hypothetical protein